jgi:hypothetical protein
MYFTGWRSGETSSLGRETCAVVAGAELAGAFEVDIHFGIRAILAGLALADVAARPTAQTAAVTLVSQLLRTTSLLNSAVRYELLTSSQI